MQHDWTSAENPSIYIHVGLESILSSQSQMERHEKSFAKRHCISWSTSNTRMRHANETTDHQNGTCLEMLLSSTSLGWVGLSAGAVLTNKGVALMELMLIRVSIDVLDPQNATHQWGTNGWNLCNLGVQHCFGPKFHGTYRIQKMDHQILELCRPPMSQNIQFYRVNSHGMRVSEIPLSYGFSERLLNDRYADMGHQCVLICSKLPAQFL